MTSFDGIDLAALLRATAKSAVHQAEVKIRTPKQIAGTVEDLNDEELDVVWTRVDAEALTNDPTQSINYEYPGVIPSVRLGEVYPGDQVRVNFDDAGASALRTSALKQLVIPFGAEHGERIRIYEEDGKGYIAFFNENGELVALFDPQGWDIGDLTTPGRRITIDPLGGIRVRSAADHLIVIIDDHGLQLRDDQTGAITAELSHGNFRLVDQNGTNDIEMVTSSAGTLPNPKWTAATEINPGSSLVVPLSPVFTTTPADDVEILHVVAWRRASDQGTATMTAPGGTTERSDEVFNDVDGTLHTSIATLDPASGAAGTFTDSLATWDHAIGTHIVIKGGGAVSPSYSSISHTEIKTTASQVTVSIPKPAGVAAGGVLLPFVSYGCSGGGVPIGWITPPGFFQLGADVSLSGSGATQSTAAVGVWAKQTDANDVAATTYETTINLPPGIKMLQTSMVYIADAFLVPGGVQIRTAGRPMRMLLDDVQLSAASAVLCDFQNISQAYDNLELVFDTSLNAAVGAQQLRMRFNADAGAHYHYRSSRSGEGVTFSALAQTQIVFAGIGGAIGSKCAGEMKVFGYKSSSRPVAMGRTWWTENLNLHDEIHSGQWDGNAGVSAINRIVIELNVAGPQFAAGSRAYLYGY